LHEKGVVPVLLNYVWKLHTFYLFTTVILFLKSKLQSSIENSSTSGGKTFESLFGKEKSGW